eukprot:TRINITY_DN30315_c0_g1_i1.p2 TRINITY_DN30315_c0_g1~~TRINITY_DN30315_c0_g1_i1.p2  ORF type:complete len:144 (-),score=6.03 TRINITY_DN30315_c0_g1_i1:292-723(-)
MSPVSQPVSQPASESQQFVETEAAALSPRMLAIQRRIEEDQVGPPLSHSRHRDELLGDPRKTEKRSDGINSMSDFDVWRQGFPLEAVLAKSSTLLDHDARLSRLYHSQVPSRVTPEEFFLRYYYALNRLHANTSWESRTPWNR